MSLIIFATAPVMVAIVVLALHQAKCASQAWGRWEDAAWKRAERAASQPAVAADSTGELLARSQEHALREFHGLYGSWLFLNSLLDALFVLAGISLIDSFWDDRDSLETIQALLLVACLLAITLCTHIFMYGSYRRDLRDGFRARREHRAFLPPFWRHIREHIRADE